MTEMDDVEPMSMEEAQDIHDLALVTDPGHDQSPCWCCCLDCDIDPDIVTTHRRPS